MSDSAELANRFRYHKPRTLKRSDDHESVRTECTIFAGFLDSLLPDGREKALALTKLEELMFWANASIARSPEEEV